MHKVKKDIDWKIRIKYLIDFLHECDNQNDIFVDDEVETLK